MNSINKLKAPSSLPTPTLPDQAQRPAAVQTGLVRQALVPVRVLKAAWSAASSEASRLKHRVSYQVRIAVTEHFAASAPAPMDASTRAHLTNARADRFNTTVSHRKWNSGSKQWLEKAGVALFGGYLRDKTLENLQYRYVEQKARTGIHVDHTSAQTIAATGSRPLDTLDEHIATIGQMIGLLEKYLDLELAQKKSRRSDDIIAKLKDCIGDLKQEKLHLQQRTRPLLKEWIGKGHTIDENAHLDHLVKLGQIPQAELQTWNDHGFSDLTTLMAFRVDMKLAELAQLAGVDTTQNLTQAQRESIRFLVEAKEAMPAVSPDDFNRLAPTLLEKQTSLDAIRLMSRQKIVQNSQTLPGTVTAGTPIQELGKGGVNTVYRVSLPDGTQVFKGEGGEVASQGENAGIGDARNGANLTGRTLVSAAVAEQLGIRSAPAARPVVLQVPGQEGLTYGTLSDFVPGASLSSGMGDSASIALSAEQHATLQSLPPETLNDIAKSYGFDAAMLESEGAAQRLTLTTPPKGQFITPLDLNSPQVRESASNLGFWAAITGQVDLHAGNIKLVPQNGGGVELVSIDNDMSAGSLHYHPNSRIAESQAHHEEWQRVIEQCIECGRSGSQEPIEKPASIGSIQRQAILAMTRERFLARYQSAGLNAQQQDQAWKRLQGIQYILRRETNDGALRIPVEATEWKPSEYGNEACSGIPKVISASLKAQILALDEDTVRHQMFGALGPAEQAAGWGRVMAIQDELSIPDHIRVIDTNDDWSTPAVTQAMGLDPAELEATARTMCKQDDFEGKATIREASMNHGILAAWGVDQAVSRLCVEGSSDSSDSSDSAQAGLSWTADARPAAYFDATAILDAALHQAAVLQENA